MAVLDSGVWGKMTPGERIKHRREKLKLSQNDLARLSGVDKAFISKIENGKTFGFVTASRLAPVLKLKVESLHRLPKTAVNGETKAQQSA